MLKVSKIRRGEELTFVYDVDSNLGGGEWDIVADWCVDNTTPEDTFIEIGAQLGYMSVHVQKFSKPKFAIYIEADVETIPLLKENLKNNCEGDYLILNSLILGNQGEAVFYRNLENPAQSSIFKRGEFKNLSPVTLQSTTIDAIVEQYNIQAPIVMKIDAEFSEPFIWKGMQKTRTKVRAMVMEYYPMKASELWLIHPEDFLLEVEKDGFKVVDQTATNIYLRKTV